MANNNEQNDEYDDGCWYECEDCGCSCTESGMDSEWVWNIEQQCYVCSGCGCVQ